MNLFGFSLQVTSVTTVEHANEILRKLFLNQYRKSLLVLDDVWSAKIIKNFEVCARVLVTTQDISILDVIPKNNVKVIPIEGGFTPEESLKVSFLLKLKSFILYAHSSTDLSSIMYLV